MINKSIQIGNMVRDPELKYSQAGKAICNFSLAINEAKDKVHYFDFTAWEKTADLIVKYCKKGSRVCVEGSPKQQRWEKDGVKHSKVVFTVDRIEFLSAKEQDAAAKVEDQFSGAPQNTDESDIPF